MCRHICHFQQTNIENRQICKGCGWKLHIKDVEKCGFLNKRYPETPVILTEDIWEKFKKEFCRVCEDINKSNHQKDYFKWSVKQLSAVHLQK